MTGFDVTVDFKKTNRALSFLADKQIPFATAKSLTQLAQLGQTRVRRSTRSKFKLRAKAFIERNIRITPAKKKDVKVGRAFSETRTDAKISDFMAGHEKGQTRRANKGRLSVPGSDLQAKSFRKSGGGVKNMYKPSTLLKDFKGSRGKRTKSKTRSKKPFIIRGKGGIPLIVKRVSKKRKPLMLLYVLSKTVKVPASWDFERTVKRAVNERATRLFEENLTKALKTAR